MSARRDDTTLAIDRGQRQLGAILRVSGAPAQPSEFALSIGSCRVGAGQGADIVIGDEAVSRLHADLTLAPDGVLVQDLGSRNGTYYLGQRIEKLVLSLGSRIQIGRAEISILPDQGSLEQGLATDLTSYGQLVGTSPAMRRLFGILSRLEGSLVTVLVEGESGTGKELVARALHQHSRVSTGPFVAVNCGALDRGLARSELFGHAKGAFTGASSTRVGAFESAAGGTLFLDEIGELPLEVQPLLLRALELGVVTRVGESAERPVSVRVVAATHRDLAGEVRAGRFREDLLYRLRVVKLELPPLRDAEDIEYLARHIAERENITELPAELLSELRCRKWPGNGRELRNALRQYAALGMLLDSTAPRKVDDHELDAALSRYIDLSRPYAGQKEDIVQRFVRIYVSALLARTGGNQSEAARIAGLERSHLNKLVAKLDGRER